MQGEFRLARLGRRRGLPRQQQEREGTEGEDVHRHAVRVLDAEGLGDR
jgi:hypothetical protein